LFSTWSYFDTFGRNLESIVLSNIRLSSRHASEKHLDVYLSDSWTLKAAADAADPGNPDNKVGRWQPIHIKDLDAHESINDPSRANTKDICELASEFVTGSLKILPSSVATIGEIHRKAHGNVQSASCREQLEEILAELCQGDKAKHNLVLGLVDQYKTQALKNASTLEESENAAEVDADVLEHRNKRQRTENEREQDISSPTDPVDKGLIVLSRDYQFEIGRQAATKADRVALAAALVAEVRAQRNENKSFETTSKIKRFVYRIGKTVDCVDQCYGGSIDAFLTAHGDWSVSAFASCKLCASGVSHVFSLG
jgi:hypothetical protein